MDMLLILGYALSLALVFLVAVGLSALKQWLLRLSVRLSHRHIQKRNAMPLPYLPTVNLNDC